jgi:hypothetical protein
VEFGQNFGDDKSTNFGTHKKKINKQRSSTNNNNNKELPLSQVNTRKRMRGEEERTKITEGG